MAQWPAQYFLTSLCSPHRIHAGHEQDKAPDGQGWHELLQRLRDHAHVLPVPLLTTDGEVRSQPRHPHQQRELLLPRLAGPPRASHLRNTPPCRRVQDRWVPCRPSCFSACPPWGHRPAFPPPAGEQAVELTRLLYLISFTLYSSGTLHFI